MPGDMPGDPCLARIYYCLRTAGDKASTSTLLCKPYFMLYGINFKLGKCRVRPSKQRVAPSTGPKATNLTVRAAGSKHLPPHPEFSS